jgi:hypothetical protein
MTPEPPAHSQSRMTIQWVANERGVEVGVDSTFCAICGAADDEPWRSRAQNLGC